MKWFLLPLLLLMNTAPALEAAPQPVRVALIFDDGPVAGVTEHWLQLFAQEQVHVTFGTVARNSLAHPELTLAAVRAGHEIANHSFSHDHPFPLSDEKLAEQILGAQQLFVEKFGVKPVWYWPPYIEVNDRVKAFALKAGITVYPIHKLVASMDYDNSVGAADIRKHATTGIIDGTIILFHEWRKESAEQFPAIMADLRAQGCVFLTFSELSASLAKEPARPAAP